jgi:glycosyltransferase involved in cell wall biosynthesis
MRSDLIATYRIDDAHVTKHFISASLGGDLNFYRRFIAQSENSSQHSVISSGNSGRDFDILVTAAKKVNASFKIYCKPSSYPKSSSIPGHVELLSGEFPYERICKDIASASIVLIPLSRKSEGVVGLTSLLEALALGKPVIMTRNNYINIDLEKENIGLTVDEGDAEGWVQAISSLLNNPRRLKEMSDNSLRLAREKFNTKIFVQELATAMEATYGHATNSSMAAGLELSPQKLSR